MPNTVKLLDCTLRDGGYYNQWDFSPDLVDAYLNAIAASGVDIVELGFRAFKTSGFKGASAFTTDDYLNTLSLPEGPQYGVMVDAKTLIESELELPQAVQALFRQVSGLQGRRA